MLSWPILSAAGSLRSNGDSATPPASSSTPAFLNSSWGTWTLFETALGVKPPDLAAAFGIVGIPLVDAGARFLAPARFGDVVEMTSQVSEFRRSSFDVEHRLFVAGAVAVEGRETRVWAAPDPADPSKMKSQPIPSGVIARFKA